MIATSNIGDTMMAENSDKNHSAYDCLKLIHKGLGDWIYGAIEDGFQSEPVTFREGNASYAHELVAIAKLMEKIEGKLNL